MPWPRTSRHQRGYGAAWVKTREQVLLRDSYLCQPCRRKGRLTVGNEVHHILPRSRGGSDDMENPLAKGCS